VTIPSDARGEPGELNKCACLSSLCAMPCHGGGCFVYLASLLLTPTLGGPKDGSARPWTPLPMPRVRHSHRTRFTLGCFNWRLTLCFSTQRRRRRWESTGLLARGGQGGSLASHSGRGMCGWAAGITWGSHRNPKGPGARQHHPVRACEGRAGLSLLQRAARVNEDELSEIESTPIKQNAKPCFVLPSAQLVTESVSFWH